MQKISFLGRKVRAVDVVQTNKQTNTHTNKLALSALSATNNGNFVRRIGFLRLFVSCEIAMEPKYGPGFEARIL